MLNTCSKQLLFDCDFIKRNIFWQMIFFLLFNGEKKIQPYPQLRNLKENLWICKDIASKLAHGI